MAERVIRFYIHLPCDLGTANGERRFNSLPADGSFHDRHLQNGQCRVSADRHFEVPA